MNVRGVRGATTVAKNTRAEIGARAVELVQAMLRANRVKPPDIAAAFFTLTPDLDADFPAHAVRRLGPAWTHVPLMCASEIAVDGALPRTLRVMLLVNTDVPASKIRHQYLGGTECLRPDLAPNGSRRADRKRSTRSSPSTTTSDGARP